MMDKKNRLIALFAEGSILLSKYNEYSWAQQLRAWEREIDRIQTDDELRKFLMQNERSVFGGMGSLLDLFLSKENGHIADDFIDANRKLQDYVDRLSDEWNEE